MSRDKHLSEIDKVLYKLAEDKEEASLPNKIAFSAEGLSSGLYRHEGFDVYTVDNDPYKALWILESSEDGQHLVRASTPISSSEEKGDWNAVSDRDRENVTLNYKNIPIARFSSKEFEFSPEDVMTFKSALLDRVESDLDFVKSVLSGQPSAKREALITSFPEFKKFI